MNKLDAVRAFAAALEPTDLVVCCNGMIGRELASCGDRAETLPMVGSMSLALSIGLGLSIVRPERRVVVLDGDGNVLMGLNAVASAAAERPRNLLHVVLDNGVHASTGGQRTISGAVPLEAIALAAGYRGARRANDLAAFGAALRAARREEGPLMVLARVEPGTTPGIARVEGTPPALAARFAGAARGKSGANVSAARRRG